MNITFKFTYPYRIIRTITTVIRIPLKNRKGIVIWLNNVSAKEEEPGAIEFKKDGINKLSSLLISELHSYPSGQSLIENLKIGTIR